MKNTLWIALLVIMTSLSSCQLIGDIFKAGVGVGAFIVIFILLAVVFLIAKLFGSSK